MRVTGDPESTRRTSLKNEAREALRLVGERVREIRRRAGLTIEHVAHEACITPGYLGRLERGEQNPTLEVIYRVARSLSVSPAGLLDIDKRDARTVRRELRERINAMEDGDLRQLSRLVDTLLAGT